MADLCVYDKLDFEQEPCADKIELVLGDNYEINVEDGKTYVVRKKPQYPKTYKECCDILDVEPYSKSAGYKSDLITAFRNLLICRDAYWKIAGEKMRLKMPWEPDYTIDKDGTGTIKFCIKNIGGKIKKIETSESNTILAFPTVEMRDTFYENFKDLIELNRDFL